LIKSVNVNFREGLGTEAREGPPSQTNRASILSLSHGVQAKTPGTNHAWLESPPRSCILKETSNWNTGRVSAECDQSKSRQPGKPGESPSRREHFQSATTSSNQITNTSLKTAHQSLHYLIQILRKQHQLESSCDAEAPSRRAPPIGSTDLISR